MSGYPKEHEQLKQLWETTLQNTGLSKLQLHTIYLFACVKLILMNL